MKKDARRSKRLPYWQTLPCPPWCYGGKWHHDDDETVDRRHVSHWTGKVTLSMVDIDPDDKIHGRTEAEYAAVDLVQDYREIEPHLWLGQSQSSTGWNLTLAEARALAEVLTKAVDLAGGQRGGAGDE
jgi:hypothetical protein